MFIFLLLLYLVMSVAKIAYGVLKGSCVSMVVFVTSYGLQIFKIKYKEFNEAVPTVEFIAKDCQDDGYVNYLLRSVAVDFAEHPSILFVFILFFVMLIVLTLYYILSYVRICKAAATGFGKDSNSKT